MSLQLDIQDYDFCVQNGVTNDGYYCVHADFGMEAASSVLSKNIFKQWMDADMPSRILVDRQGKVVWCRIMIDGLATTGDNDLSLQKVRVGGSLASDMFLPILKAGSLAQPGQSRITLIECTFVKHNIVARVTPLGHPQTGPFGVTIGSRQGFTDSARTDLKRIWDLSAGETRVLSMTFQGLTVHEVSEITELSIETIRTHIRHIYTKVGVNSREALFATIGPAIF